MRGKTRRAWLCAVAAGVAGIAGCSSSDQPASDTETSSASETPTATEGQPTTPTTTLTPTSSPSTTSPTTQPPTSTTTTTDSPTPTPTQQPEIAAADGDSGDEFGWSVAVSADGSTAIIGAKSDEDPNDINSGSAYVFESSGRGWSQQAKLTPDDGDSGDEFGVSVAVSADGGTAIIAAISDEDPNGDGAGSAYVFESSGGGWSQQAKLAADDGDSDDNFGVSVAVSGDGTTAIIGANFAFGGEPNEGSAGVAYVFESSGGDWSQQARLTPVDGDSFDTFGSSVAVSADGATAVIGASDDEDPNGANAGSAYVFESSGGDWSQQAKLTADDGDTRDLFGLPVAVSSEGATAIIGALGDDIPAGNQAGAAYVFESSGGGWSQQTKLTADERGGGDTFGGSVAVSADGATAIIGALGDDEPNGDEAGSAYVFDI